MFLAHFLRLMLDGRTPDQRTSTQSTRIKLKSPHAKWSNTTYYLNSLMMVRCSLLQKSSIDDLSDCKTTGEL